LVVFDIVEIEHWTQTHFDWLYDDNSFQTLSQSQRVQLWGVCAVYRLGGIFASSTTSLSELNSLCKSMSLYCSIDDTAQLWFQSELEDDSDDNTSNSNRRGNIHYLAATPRHLHLHCALQGLQFRMELRE
jgi:hypothetical protein